MFERQLELNMDYKLKHFEDSEDSGSESDSSIDLDYGDQNGKLM